MSVPGGLTQRSDQGSTGRWQLILLSEVLKSEVTTAIVYAYRMHRDFYLENENSPQILI